MKGPRIEGSINRLNGEVYTRVRKEFLGPSTPIPLLKELMDERECDRLVRRGLVFKSKSGHPGSEG